MGANAAQNHALGLPEVLENILVQVSIEDLFVRQRVSKRFQATIAESPGIQHKMFLALNNPPGGKWKCVRKYWSDGWFEESTLVEVANVQSNTHDGSQLGTPVTLKPVLTVTVSHCGFQTRVLLNGRAQSLSPHLSLLTTYISDPPYKVAQVNAKFVLARAPAEAPSQLPLHGLRSVEITVRSETGLKLEDLWDACLNARGDHTVCYGSGGQFGTIDGRRGTTPREVLTKYKNPGVTWSLL